MPWDRPTLNQLYERISQDFSGRLLDGGAVLMRSVIAVISKIWAGACHLMHGMLAWLFLQVFADTAEGPYLERWARIWGIFRLPASHAVGPVNFQGQDGSLIPAGLLMQHQPTGLLYAAQGDAAAINGVISITVRAVMPGAASNQPTGASLTLIAPIAGIMANGIVMPDGITGGVDEEDDDSLRQRLLDRLRKPPRGGAKHDYEAWAREVPGVTRAWCYPMGLGIGTVSLTFVTDNAPTGPIPTTEMVKRVQDHIEPLRPATVKEWSAFAPEELPIVISLSVTPNTEAVRTAVKRELGDFIYREGMPDTDHNTEVWLIYLSRIRQSISLAPGVLDYTLHDPVANIEVFSGYFPMLQDVIFGGAEA
jgi:uncharacterized phage protein gp47/JayE